MFGKFFLIASLILIPMGARAQAPPPPNNPNGQGTPHGVLLTYSASPTANVVGYNIYRSTVSGSLFVRVNSTLVAGLTYLDPASGLAVSTNYFYVATAVDSNNNESVFSNQVSVTTPATFPVNPQAPPGLAAKNQ